jgi:hypothetical protein
MQSPKYISDVENTSDFLIYNNYSEKNILFIGSCRIVPLMFYFNSVGIEPLRRNVYAILIYKHPVIDEEYMRQILQKTDIIVCENIERYPGMNTNVSAGSTFFNRFKIKNTKIMFIPNLELHMFHHDIINVFNIKKELVKEHYNSSREFLINRMKRIGYIELWEEIDENISKYRLFTTYNHPTKLLSCMLFKYLLRKLGYTVDISKYREFLKYNFLEGNDTPLFEDDIRMHNISFEYELSHYTFLNVKELIVRAPEVLKTPHDDLFK